MAIGKSCSRIDAYAKVTGQAKYTEDLIPNNALVGKVVHSTISNGWVKHIDVSQALELPGVEKIVTCFEVPDLQFPTAGHPWSTDPKHQDIADRKLLNQRVRFYGDDIAAIIARDEITAERACQLIKIEYEVLPPSLTIEEAMQAGVTPLHEESPSNILKYSNRCLGDYEAALQEPGLRLVEGRFETQVVQHCHLEKPISFAYVEAGRIVIVSSTQIPHIVRRVVGQALGIPWGKVRDR